MNRLLIMIVFAAALLMLPGCWHGGNTQTFTGPPPRTIPLDSVTVNKANPRNVEYIYPPDTLTVDFVVPGEDSCRVIVEVRKTSTKVVRSIVDSVFAPGKHAITWPVKNERGLGLEYRLYFYYLDICGKISSRRLDYRRKPQN
ncbi:MAG: hypothetical protein JSV44_03690 [Candidatus Zixiibacteriota bacterium]|nr:MAG: hypothetical protein JSV44_03690 [candidate division Zixibacteria bacterium]